MPGTIDLTPLSNLDLNELISDFRAAGDSFCTPLNKVKFLCGIQTPVFMKIKAKILPNFGLLKHYPFMEVKAWVEAQE